MRRVLLATDGSLQSLNAAGYLKDLYQGGPELEVTICTISPAVPPLFKEESKDPRIQGQIDAWEKRRQEEGDENIRAAEKVLLEGGLDKSRIDSKYRIQFVGVARDIIREMDSGRYDACLVGKKGLSWFHDVFLGSIASKLLEISADHPMWLNEGKNVNPRKVIIAMDETEHAVALSRHAGRMLRGLDGVELLFFHCCCPFTEKLSAEERAQMMETEKLIVEEKKEHMSHHFEDARQVLQKMGFSSAAINYDFHYDGRTHPRNVSSAILDKVEEGGFGTLIVGRKGSTRAREFSIGSVTGRIAAGIKRCCLWVV